LLKLFFFQDLADITKQLAKHDNETAQNASMRLTDDSNTDIHVTPDGAEESPRLSAAAVQQNVINAQQTKVNIANGQISTSIKIEPNGNGGRVIKVAPPVVAITGNDEM